MGEQTSIAGVLNWFLAVCAGISPLRIHRSFGWIQRRTRKLLRSDRNRVGVLSARYLFRAASLAALRNVRP